MLKRIYQLLLPDERHKVLKMALSVLGTALLDFVGLAVLLPVLYALLDESGQQEAALTFSLIAVTVVLVKCVLTTLLARYQNQCLLSLYKRLSHSLFSSYYRRGLLYIREHGSNKLGHEINAMCYAFSFSLLAPLCRIAGELLLLVLVTIALLWWNGVTVLLLYAVFIPFMCCYFMGVRGKIREYGEEDMRVKRSQARVVMDALRGYTELEVHGAFPTLQQMFLAGMERISHNRMKMDTLLRVPQLLSELSVVVGLVLLVAFGQGDMKLVVGVFAVAAFRLLPALRTVLGGWTQIQNAACCLEVVENGLKDYEAGETAETVDVVFKKEISIEGLTYAYDKEETVLDNLTLGVKKGEYVGICGTSGVGKTTLFNILTGLIEPDAGKIKVDGVALTRAMRASWMKKISYVPQEVFVFDGTLAENIALGCEVIDMPRVREVLAKVSLEEWVAVLPAGVDSPMSEAGGKLSGGQRQRIGIARALYKGAELLLLDEATSALDDATEKDINGTLDELRKAVPGLTILSIAHRESSLGYCDRIICIE